MSTIFASVQDDFFGRKNMPPSGGGRLICPVVLYVDKYGMLFGANFCGMQPTLSDARTEGDNLSCNNETGSSAL